MNKRNFVWKFTEILQTNGDMFFSCGDVSQDWFLIRERITNQGFWSGERFRYYFDKDFNLDYIESRF